MRSTPFRVPLSAIRDADVVAVLGDAPVVERAPIVDLWIRDARRRGARVLYELDEEAVRGAKNAILIWCGPGGHGGATVAAHAQRLGASGAFYIPETANGRGVCDAWACAADTEPSNPDPVGLLIVSGDEAAANPVVRALAEKAERVLVSSMFHGLAAGWADLVLPGTSYLERDGTYVNLEGRVQRLRRTVIPPAPDELAWISKLAERFGVEVSPYPSLVFEEVSAIAFGGIPFGEIGERAPLPAATDADAPIERARRTVQTSSGGLTPRPLSPALLGPRGRARPRARLSAAATRSRALARKTPESAGSGTATRSPCARTERPSSCARASPGSFDPASCACRRTSQESCNPSVEVSK